MKTICKTLFFITSILMVSSCAEEELGDVTGKYGNLTGDSDTVITISKNSNGYTLNCSYEEFRSGDYYTWNGTFQTIPSDVVKSNGTQIGTVNFSSGEVTFTASTQRKGTYKAYADELADLPRSSRRTISSSADSLSIDSIDVEIATEE